MRWTALSKAAGSGSEPRSLSGLSAAAAADAQEPSLAARDAAAWRRRRRCATAAWRCRPRPAASAADLCAQLVAGTLGGMQPSCQGILSCASYLVPVSMHGAASSAPFRPRESPPPFDASASAQPHGRPLPVSSLLPGPVPGPSPAAAARPAHPAQQTHRQETVAHRHIGQARWMCNKRIIRRMLRVRTDVCKQDG